MAYRHYHHRHHRHGGGSSDDSGMGCLVMIILWLEQDIKEVWFLNKFDLQKQMHDRQKEIHEKGFMSVSLIPNVNIMIARKVRLMIMVPKGTKAYVTHNVVESEAILPPNTNLVVKDVHYNRYRNRFDVHCVVEQNFE